ncbi:MAG TPA: hypothetical protein PK811_02940, partial [bacterium]|nr:hypothetical protein [bacterium]
RQRWYRRGKGDINWTFRGMGGYKKVSKKELLERLSEIDKKILSLFIPVEISDLVMEREKLLESVLEIELSLQECYALEESNRKIMQHLKEIEMDLERRLGELKQYSSLYKSYYLSRYNLKDNLLSERV